VSELFRRSPKIFEQGPPMFQSYNSVSEFFLRDYIAITMVITYEDMFTRETSPGISLVFI